jgi:hypothetical protein
MSASDYQQFPKKVEHKRPWHIWSFAMGLLGLVSVILILLNQFNKLSFAAPP